MHKHIILGERFSQAKIMIYMQINYSSQCFFPLHRPNQLPIPSIRPRILQRNNRPYRRRNPPDQRNLQDQTNNPSKNPSPKQKRKKRKENRNQSHNTSIIEVVAPHFVNSPLNTSNPLRSLFRNSILFPKQFPKSCFFK